MRILDIFHRVICGVVYGIAFSIGAATVHAADTAASSGQGTPSVTQPQSGASVSNVIDTYAQPVPQTPRIDERGAAVPGFSKADVGGVLNIAPAQGNASATRNDPRAAAYSQNWLIDGMQQLEAESRQGKDEAAKTKTGRGNANDPGNQWIHGTGGQGNGDTGKTQQDQSPAGVFSSVNTGSVAPSGNAQPKNIAENSARALQIESYFSRWITSPEGKAALNAATAANAQADGAADPRKLPYRTQSPDLSASMWAPADSVAKNSTSPLTSPGLPGTPVKNPYIDDPEEPLLNATGPNVVQRPPEIPESTAAAAAKAGTAPASTLDSGVLPIDTSKLIIKPIEPPTTDPIINTSKYFPQLQRF